MLAVVLALVAAIGYGGSDFAAGMASRSAAVIRVALLGSVVSLVAVAATLPFAAGHHRPAAAALAWGAVAGLGGTAGALALYLGFRQAAFSVAGPLSAVGAAGFCVLAGLLYGERPTALVLAGIVLALPAIVGVSASAARDGAADTETDPGGPGPAQGAGEQPGPAQGAGERPRPAQGAGEQPGPAQGAGEQPGSGQKTRRRSGAGVGAGLIAGACFALLFIGLDRAGSGSGLWPVAAAGTAEVISAFGVAAVTGNLRLPGGQPGRLAVITGLTGAAGTISYFFATHEGFLAITAVLTSLYPAVTIVLARAVLGERLTWLRLAGLVLAAACVALIAAGGAG
jgi:drug/metabolite transporter (DMT)-like permease